LVGAVPRHAVGSLQKALPLILWSPQNSRDRIFNRALRRVVSNAVKNS